MTSIVVERVVLSAYIMNLNKLLEFAISFTYIIKIKGPSMDHWGNTSGYC